MSTPVAAGAAALVRQYLEEGFHTCGARSDEGGGMRNPSAALVKAMLISSARLPTSNFTRYHANTDHGTCQAHQVEGGGFPNTGAGRDSYCKLVHGDQAACSDLSRLLRDEDGESIYCSTPGADGCEHTLHCCTCSPVSALASRIRREGGCSPRRRSKWNWFTSTAVPNPGIHVHQSKHRSSGGCDAMRTLVPQSDGDSDCARRFNGAATGTATTWQSAWRRAARITEWNALRRTSGTTTTTRLGGGCWSTRSRPRATTCRWAPAGKKGGPT